MKVTAVDFMATLSPGFGRIILDQAIIEEIYASAMSLVTGVPYIPPSGGGVVPMKVVEAAAGAAGRIQVGPIREPRAVTGRTRMSFHPRRKRSFLRINLLQRRKSSPLALRRLCRIRR